MSELMTPYLPTVAKMEARAHQASGKAVFFRVMAPPLHPPNLAIHCRNCAGVGELFVTFCESGPHHANPSQHVASTWYDGDGVLGKGWYKIDKTVAYACPHCKGTGRGERRSPVSVPAVEVAV